jgi:hypothetical protein
MISVILFDYNGSEIINKLASILSINKIKSSVIDLSTFSSYDKALLYIKELEMNNTDIMLLKINDIKDYEKLFKKHIINVLCINSHSEELSDEKSCILKNIIEGLRKNSIILLNSDNLSNFPKCENLNFECISYGLYSKNTVTLSSSYNDHIGGDITICIQRAFKSISNKLIEPQEISINIKDCNKNDIYDILAVATLLLLFDCEIKDIYKL